MHALGLPLRAQRVKVPRLSGVGFNYPKASDHCPVAVDLKLVPFVRNFFFLMNFGLFSCRSRRRRVR